MKKVFWITFILILLIAAAVGVFALTFNADSYRPFFQQKLQEAVKKPVRIKKISLGWNGGIALDVDGLTIFKDEKSPDALVRFEKASVLVNAKPLLQREIQISSIILVRPEIDFVKTPRREVPTAAAPAGTVTSSGNNSGAASVAAMSFLVDEIKIRNGRIHYADPLARSPVDISIRDLDAAIHNISLTGPLDFDGKASIFSDRQNTSIEGKIILRGPGALDIENLLMRVQLEAMDPAKILKSLPALQTVGLAQGLAGDAEGSLKRIRIVDGAVQELEGEVHLAQARFKTADMPLPFENGTVDANFSLNHFALQKMTGNIGSGKFSASGLAQNLQGPQAQSQADLRLTGLWLTDLIPPVSQSEPYMEGIASFNLHAGAAGIKDYEIEQTLTGNAQINIQNGVLRNMNVLREIFDKLSMIPGVSKSLQSRLPQGYSEKLQQRDTLFLPIEIPVTISQGGYFFDRTVLQSESFAVLASGKGDMDGNLQGEASLIIEPQLSQAMMAGVNELQYLSDSKGQLQVPLILQAVRGKFSITPNVSYVLSKLAAAKTQQVLANLLKQKNDTDQTAGTSQQTNPLGQNTQSQQGLGGGLLGQLLSSALESQSSKNGSSSR